MFITPPYHCGVVESAGVWLPLGFVYLAASVREIGYEPIIYDAMSYFHGYKEIEKMISEENPDFVCTTAYTSMINDALKVLRIAKEVNENCITIIGGVHPTFCWEEVLSTAKGTVDFVVRGEGELTLKELLLAIETGSPLDKVEGIAYFSGDKIVKTKDRPFIQNLDDLKMAWDLLDWRIYTYRPNKGSVLAVMSSSRGCNQMCSFCSQQAFWKRTWRALSPERFVQEMEKLHRQYGVDVIMITDETPTIDRDRWERILKLIIKKDLDVELLMETRVDDIIRDEDIIDLYWDAGVRHIYIGVESAFQDQLDLFKKNIEVEQSKKAIEIINSAGIISETSFVLGSPNDTVETFEVTAELAIYYNPDLAFFLALTPWPYSDVYKEMKEYIVDKDYSHYNLVTPVIKPKNLTIEEVDQLLFECFKKFYLHKMKQIPYMSKYKRDYMISVFKLLVEHSYLGESLKKMFKGQETFFTKGLLSKAKI